MDLIGIIKSTSLLITPRLVYDSFGTWTPRILRRPHRLLIPSPETFRLALSALEYRACDFGAKPPSMTNRAPDYGAQYGAMENAVTSEWREEANQVYLANVIENYKFGYSPGPILDATLQEAITNKISESRIGQMLRQGRTNIAEWFDTLDSLLDECRWLYLPLPECTRFDLLVFSNEEAQHTLPCLDRALEARSAKWQGNDLIWPHE